MMSTAQWLSEAAPKLNLAGLAEHTEEVKPDFGFICVAADTAQRNAYVKQAITRGASAVLIEQADAEVETNDVPQFEIANLAAVRGELAARFYNEPSKSVSCIGITGTNGKTSVAFHIADLLNTLGHTSGYMGTLGWGLLGELQDPNLTTGNAVALQRRLAELKRLGCDVVAMEVSSHALAQERAHAVSFSVAVYTNLSRDHLDYHGTMDAYAEAKARLLSDFPVELCILNADDEFCSTLKAPVGCKVVTYGHAGQWRWRREGSVVSWQTPHGEVSSELNVVADYAIANITVAMIIATEMGHGLDDCEQALANLSPVPGRLEVITDNAEQPNERPTVAVDFAHTPDALEKVLEAARAFSTGRILCVVGCGGDRDKGKRPEMGAISARLSDLVWLTSDNPRSEEPDQIIADMLDGITEGRERVNVCVDRGEAIADAITNAAPEDLVLIAGKGHEDYQEIAGVKLPFSDHQVARKALKRH